MKSEREEGYGKAGAHGSLEDEGGNETKVSRSSETKVSETRFSCSSESKLSVGGCFYIFVGNIPPSSSKRGLHRMFEPFGSIVDIFLSRKYCQFSPMSFAFMRFQEPDVVTNAINNLNRVYMDSHRLKADSARA